MTKPTVFNYKNHEELRQAYKELLADNQQLTADNRKLRKEVTELKQLNDGYVKIIAKNQETNNKLMASVQGEWQFREVQLVRGGTSFGYVCSNCGKDYWQVDGLHFCPNCGVRMQNGYKSVGQAWNTEQRR